MVPRVARLTAVPSAVVALTTFAPAAFAGERGESKKETTSTVSKKCIVDTATGAGRFNTLVKAVQSAGLEQPLRRKGPFTVFAPADEAFSKLPKDTVVDLLKPENKEKLASILSYHVVPGKVLAAEVVKLSSAKTVNGKEVKITVED